MPQDIEIPHAYIENLPKSQCVSQLLGIAQKEAKEAHSRPLKLCDFAKHPEPSKAKGYGRYESDKQIIWIRLGLPSYVTEFVVAHELGHSLLQVRGYPRVSLKDTLRTLCAGSYPATIICLQALTDGISNVLLDPGADEIARTYGLFTKQALEYLRCEDQTGITSTALTPFDGNELRCSIKNVLQNLASGQWPPDDDSVSLLELARLATVYATLCHRYDPHGLFGVLDDVYKRNLPTVRELGIKLADIAQISKLQTADGCKEIAKQLIKYLQIPQEAVGVKI